jgi:hypothetical protein
MTEETRKSGRPRKRWKDEDEEDLNITRIINRQEMTRDRWEWREIVLGAKVHRGLWKRKEGWEEEEKGEEKSKGGRRLKCWW